MTASDEYITPSILYDPLNIIFQFDLDAAASETNAKCRRFLTKEMNALRCPWEGKSVWCNPPYSKDAGPLDQWIKKACLESCGNADSVLMLGICDISTEYFEYSLSTAYETILLGQRIKFDGASQGAKFASMLSWFKKGPVGHNISMWNWKYEHFNERRRI